MSAFLAENQHFLAKIVTLLKVIVWELCWRFVCPVFSFCKVKSLTEYASGIRLLHCFKLTVNCKNDVTIFWNGVFVEWFWHCFVSPIKFSYSSKFHVNIITGSSHHWVMIISFYKGLTRNPEIVNTSFWVFLNIWRLGRVRNTKYGRTTLIKCY